MRKDVLEVMADELLERAAHPLASFSTWDDGRRKLDGMQAGRRWDLDREMREEKRENEALYNRLRWRRWYADPANKKHFSVYRKQWGAANRDKERAYEAKKLAARRKDPKRWALYKARMERHRRKKKPSARVGNRRCSVCRQPGHNMRRCSQKAKP